MATTETADIMGTGDVTTGVCVSTHSIDQPRATRSSVLPGLLLLSAGCLSSSSAHASVKGAWADNVSRDQSFSRVLVVGVSPDRNQRCSFEEALASKIRSANTVAIVSCNVMPAKAPLTRENVEAAVAAQNADAVLATSLITRSWEAKEGGTRDTQGNAQYKATDAYYGVYGTVVAVDFQTSAAITTLKGEAHVTSKLYETRGATVVYTVDTKVRNIESRETGLLEITVPIGKRLRKDGLIR
jgi:lipopolysaccharide export system protein LptA